MIVLAAIASIACAPPAAVYDAESVYNEACRITEERFLDPDMHGVDWSAEVARARGDAASAESPAQLAAIVNGLLDQLNTSHTRMYPAGGRAWAELLDVFFSDGFPEQHRSTLGSDTPEYLGIGFVTREIGSRVFLADVYPESPASASGLQVGDELVSLSGQRWTDDLPWPAEAGEEIELTFRRHADEEVYSIAVAARVIRPHELFLAAQRASAELIETASGTIGYVHLRTYAGDRYHDLLTEQLIHGDLANADALVLDIRGGWGGARLDFLSLFDQQRPKSMYRTRDGDWQTASATWTKPLVVLIDEGSRSGKELLAFGFKKSGRATLVGAQTGAAVVGGSINVLADGSALYIATLDVLVDGVRIEGVGVEPDVAVAFELPYAAGHDPQRARAIEEAAGLIE